MKLPSALRALAYRNYRLFFFGQGISLIGTWMQQIALSWLVFTMTGSSLQLGLVLFCGQIPTLLLSPLVGVMMEGWNRRKVLVVTQCVALGQALLLTVLTLTDSVTLSIIWPLSLLLGVVTTFDVNARQSFISVMVEKREDMVNAIALNSSLVNSARLIGPALAAFVLAHSNAATCFGINSLSYLAVIYSLWSMRGVSGAPAVAVKTPLLKSLNEGFAYVKDFVPFRVVLLNLSVASMAGAAYNVMLPEFSVHVLSGNASTLALLSSANGLGALVAAVMLAMRKKVVGLGRWIIAGNSMMGLALVGFSFISTQGWALVALFFIGFGLMGQAASTNTFLQTIADPAKRARVMSFYILSFLGMAPLGSLLSGFITERLGLGMSFIFMGGMCLGSALYMQRQLPEMRKILLPIYLRLQLIDEVSAGIATASELKNVTRS